VTRPPEYWQLSIPFEALVLEYIGPALEGYGFQRSVLQANHIRFGNGAVVLDVEHDPRDGEVAINFWRTRDEKHFSFLMYLRATAPDDPAAGGTGISWTEEEVATNLEKFGRALATYGQPILLGDEATYESMKSVRWWNVPRNGATDPPTGSG
jgi:hypothetical protein